MSYSDVRNVKKNEGRRIHFGDKVSERSLKSEKSAFVTENGDSISVCPNISRISKLIQLVMFLQVNLII